MKIFKLIIFFLVCISFSLSSFAGGFQVSLQDQKALGMGHTGVSKPMGASSIFFNPGALSFTKGIRFSASTNLIMSRLNYLHNPSGESGSANSQIGTPFSFYFAAQLKPNASEGKLSNIHLGLGVFTPFGSKVQYDDEWVGRFIVQEINLNTIFIQPTFSYQITEFLGLGIGFVYGIGNLYLKQAVALESDESVEGSSELEGQAIGKGFMGGAYLKPLDWLSIGVSYRSGVRAEIKDGKSVFDVPESLRYVFNNPNFYTKIRLPNSVSIGATAFITKDRNTFINFQLDRTGWETYEELKFEFKDVVGSATEIASPRDYHDNYTIRVGGQYSPFDLLQLRAGFYYDTDVAPDCCITPESPDSNSWGTTIGASILPSDNISIDLAFLFVDGQERSSTNLESGFNATYKTSSFIPGIGISCAF